MALPVAIVDRYKYGPCLLPLLHLLQRSSPGPRRRSHGCALLPPSSPPARPRALSVTAPAVDTAHRTNPGGLTIASNAAAQHPYFSRYSRNSSSTTSPISWPSSTALADARRLRAVGMRPMSWERFCFIRPCPLGRLARPSVDGLRGDRRLLGWVRFRPSPLPSFAASMLVPSPRACVASPGCRSVSWSCCCSAGASTAAAR